MVNATYYSVEASGENKWDTDSWNPGIPFQQPLFPGADNVYGSDGGFMRGCGNSSTWTIIDGPPGVQGTTFSLSATIPYGGEQPGSIQGNCSSSSSAFKCMFDQGESQHLVSRARERSLAECEGHAGGCWVHTGRARL